MTQSPEYPDLAWMPPASYSSGRPDGPPLWIVWHYTAGHEGPNDGENGAAYDRVRTDGTSTHYHVDSDSVVQCVRTTDRSHTALYTGNARGIHYELAGTLQTRAQWLDAVSRATIRNAARQAARDATKYGIPTRRLTLDQMRRGEKGHCGHVDVTYAFPEDGGDHTDPGPEFPWDVALGDVAESLRGDEMSDLDYGGWGRPAPVGGRPAAVLLADLWAGEQTKAGAYGPDKSERARQLDRIEAAASAAAPVVLTDAQLAAVTAAMATAVTASLAGLTAAVQDLAARLSAAGDALNG